MDTSAASTAPLARAPGYLPGPLNQLQALPLKSKLALAIGAVLVLALLAMGIAAGRQPEWRVLFAGLSDKDGGTVVAALSQMNIAHRFSDAGGAIMVPADRVHELRLRLAAQGLPKGGTVGFELMENQKFGVTQFQERLNFQRGLEGELARSIMALSAVQSARVHLALPQQTAFLREQQKPSASVLLALNGGQALDRGQINGIVHLVASSVPDLSPKAVSVVDQTGALLSQTPGEPPNGLSSAQLEHMRQTEQSLSARILAIVEPIVGPGNIKAQVTADLDFTQSESTAELYGPNQGSTPAAIRSQQLSEAPGGAGGSGAGGSSGLGSGVPGALSNQPPPAVASPINGAPQALGAGGAPPTGGGVKRDAMTNYEVDKTVRVTRSATGTIKRLNAAVVVNHASLPGPDGKPQLKPREAAQMEQITALVREAVGFSKERGDSVNVVNASFTSTPLPVAEELPLWRQPQMLDTARSLAPWLALPLVALIIILGLVRPALRAASSSATPVRLLETTVRDAITLPAPPRGQGGAQPTVAALPPAQQEALTTARSTNVENIRQIARQNPATVANVVRNWAEQPA